MLVNDILPLVENSLPIVWKFLQDNDPKRTPRLVKNWYLDQMVNWKYVTATEIKNLTKKHHPQSMWKVIPEEEANIPVEVSQLCWLDEQAMSRSY